jgi:hypothetical protein
VQCFEVPKKMKFSSSVTTALLASASLMSRSSAFSVVRHASSSVPALATRYHQQQTFPRSVAASSATAATGGLARPFSSSTTTLSMASVLKLSDPQSELLDQVDVFIFDCDGVIWRVCFHRRPSLWCWFY